MNDPKYLFLLEEDTEVFTTVPGGIHTSASTVAAYDYADGTHLHNSEGESVPAYKLAVAGGSIYVPAKAIVEIQDLPTGGRNPILNKPPEPPAGAGN